MIVDYALEPRLKKGDRFLNVRSVAHDFYDDKFAYVILIQRNGTPHRERLDAIDQSRRAPSIRQEVGDEQPVRPRRRWPHADAQRD
jgi:hypothetical protein